MKKILLFFILFWAMSIHAQEFFLLDSTQGIFGFKNKGGQIDPSFRYYCPERYPLFSEGLARMYTFVPFLDTDSIQAWGYVNQAGQVVIPFKYRMADDFYAGVAQVSYRSLPKNDDDSPAEEAMLIDKKGKEYRLSSEYGNIRSFTEGMAIVCNDSRMCQGKYGFIDTTGREICPLKYDQVWEFSEGLAAVNVGASECQGGKWGFIDRTGKEVIPLIYDYVGMIDSGYDLFGFQFGRAIVGIGEESFYIDKKGATTKIPPRKDSEPVDFGYMNHENPIRIEENGKYGFRDEQGLIIVPPKYDWVSHFYQGITILPVRLGGKQAYLNAAGKEITPFKYDDAREFYDGCAVVFTKISAKNSGYGIIDSTGREIVEPGTYENIHDFSNERAVVVKNNKRGFVDTAGREVIPCIYDRADDFFNGKAKVKVYDRHFYIDKQGRAIKD